MKACLNCGRETKTVTRGYCSGCYSRLWRKGTLERTNVINVGKCSIVGCEKDAFAKNMCGYHYERSKHPLMPLWRSLRSRYRGNYPLEWDVFAKFLADVGEKPTDRHYLRRLNAMLPYAANNVEWRAPIMPEKTRGEAAKALEYGREWQLRNKYNLTRAEYAAIFHAQDGKCAICKCAETALDRTRKTVRPLAVEHDHRTKVVRGLACNRCNHLLGLANDSIDLLQAAIDYLRSHQTGTET